MSIHLQAAAIIHVIYNAGILVALL